MEWPRLPTGNPVSALPTPGPAGQHLTIASGSTGSALRIAALALISALAVACGGSSDSGSPGTDNRSVTQPPVTQPPVGDNETPDTPDSNNVDPSTGKEIYYRAADFPNALNLPLQFITTSGGKMLSVRGT